MAVLRSLQCHVCGNHFAIAQSQADQWEHRGPICGGCAGEGHEHDEDSCWRCLTTLRNSLQDEVTDLTAQLEVEGQKHTEARIDLARAERPLREADTRLQELPGKMDALIGMVSKLVPAEYDDGALDAAEAGNRNRDARIEQLDKMLHDKQVECRRLRRRANDKEAASADLVDRHRLTKLQLEARIDRLKTELTTQNRTVARLKGAKDEDNTTTPDPEPESPEEAVSASQSGDAAYDEEGLTR